MRLETVRSVGIRKLAAAEVPGIGAAARRRIGRSAALHARRLSGLKYNDITPEAQTRIDLERSLLGAIQGMATSVTTKFTPGDQTPPTTDIMPK